MVKPSTAMKILLIAKITITSSNDIFQDFIDSKINITNNPNDRLGKNTIHQLFCSMFPKKMITVQQVINSVKEKGIKYDYALRCDSVKGSFVGISIKSKYDDDEKDEEIIEEINYEELHKKSEAQNRFLKELLKSHNIDLSAYNLN